MAGKARIALFRARDDAAGSAAALAQRGFGAACAPVIEIGATGAPAPAGAFDFAIATSAKAFDFAIPAVLRALSGLPLHVVGEKTAAAARRAGFARLAAPATDVAALLPTLPPGHALYLAGRDRKPELEAALGDRVEALALYQARARAGWDAAEAQVVGGSAAALHYSSRSAELAALCAERAGLAAMFRGMPHVCLSRDVAAPLAARGFAHVYWPQRPEEGLLLDTLESALSDRLPFGA